MSQWIFRAILLLAVSIVGVGVWRNTWIQESKQALSTNTPNTSTKDATDETEGNDAQETPSTASGIGSPLVSPDDFAQADDESNYKNPITRGLGAWLDSQGAILGDAGDDLSNNLETADNMLADAKRSNRNAIREANRTPRLPGRSPNVVLITVGGLNATLLKDVDSKVGEAPALEILATQSVRQQVEPANLAASRAMLLTGQANAAEVTEETPTLTNMMWQSGYQTAIIGDCSWWGISRDVDEWFGAREADDTDPFPEFVWSGGKRIRIVDNADRNDSISRNRLYLTEADSYFQRHQGGRPFFLAISLNVDEEHSPLADIDRLIRDLNKSLVARKLAGRTLYCVVGLPTNSAEPGLLIAQHGNQLPAGSEMSSEARFVDLTATVTKFAGATRVPKLSGRPLYTSWRSVGSSSKD